MLHKRGCFTNPRGTLPWWYPPPGSSVEERFWRDHCLWSRERDVMAKRRSRESGVEADLRSSLR